MIKEQIEAATKRGLEWICVTCGSPYAEYTNGCPHCWAVGIRSGVRRIADALEKKP